MTQADLMRLTIGALDRSGIPHMLRGSVAAAYYGAGRATMDIDFVIDPTREQLREFERYVSGPHVYCSIDAANDALSTRSMFNIIDGATGWKADLIIRKERPFSALEFSRRRAAEFDGLTVSIATVEDVIVSKLEWAKAGASARQLEDVRALLRVQGESLDRVYVEQWVNTLALNEVWATSLRSQF